MHLQKIVRSFRIQLLHGTPSNIYINMFMQKTNDSRLPTTERQESRDI